jgi:hypothetical protein
METRLRYQFSLSEELVGDDDNLLAMTSPPPRFPA